jgi:hypothetical protein
MAPEKLAMERSKPLTNAIGKLEQHFEPRSRSTARTEDIYIITSKSSENVMSTSGHGVDFEVTKISQEYARPSINLPIAGKITIPFTTAKPVGEPTGPTIVKAGTLAYEYAIARYPPAESITEDFFAREYIVRSSEYQPGGFVRAREEIFGAEARSLIKGSKEYLSVWDLAGEQSVKTGQNQVALFNKLIKTPEGYRSGSMAFGRTSEGVTLRNVWEKGTIITEARPASDIQVNPIYDISPYVYKAERTDLSSVKGNVIAMEQTTVTRELGISKAGLPSFESNVGITGKILAYSGEQPAYESRRTIERTIKASTEINTLFGSSFPLKGKPIIGEYQGIVQNVLDRLIIANTLKGSMGRPEGLKVSAGSIEDMNVAARAISKPSLRSGMKNIWAVKEITKSQSPKPLPDWYKKATGVVAIQKEPQQKISYLKPELSLHYAATDEETEYISTFVSKIRKNLGLVASRGSYIPSGVITSPMVTPIVSPQVMQTVPQLTNQKNVFEPTIETKLKLSTSSIVGLDLRARVGTINDIAQIPAMSQRQYQNQTPAQIATPISPTPPTIPRTPYSKPPAPYTNIPPTIPMIGGIPVFGGENAQSGGYRRGRSWVNVHPVGADLLSKYRNAPAPKIRFKAPKFKFPKF